MLIGESEMRLLLPITLPLRERDETVPGGLPGADKFRTFEIYITLVSSLDDVVNLRAMQ